MGTAIVIVIIVVICVFAIYSYGHKMRHGGGCCGSHEAAEKKVKVADKNKDHYPYEVTLIIDGMTCSNCSRRMDLAADLLRNTNQTVLQVAASVGYESASQFSQIFKRHYHLPPAQYRRQMAQQNV